MTKRRGSVKKLICLKKNTDLPQMVTEFMDMAKSFGNAEWAI